jgi:UPF0716 family protein affecting phage T7 exclusion
MAGTVLVIPVVCLVTGLLRGLWALRRTTGCGWGDAARALRIWFALSWVVSLACVRGLVRRGAVFLRTPKAKEGTSTLGRALRYSLAESVIAATTALAVAAMLLRAPGLSTALLGLLLLFEAFIYVSAPWASAAAERIAMTPARRVFLRSAQNTGNRPPAAPALTAMGAGGVAALAVDHPIRDANGDGVRNTNRHRLPHADAPVVPHPNADAHSDRDVDAHPVARPHSRPGAAMIFGESESNSSPPSAPFAPGASTLGGA